MEKDKNIFETAASSNLGKKKKQQPSSKKKTHQDPEIAAMLNQIEVMKQDLENKLEKIRQQTGLSKEDLQNFMNNPKNFSPNEWAKLEKTKNEMGDKVWSAIGLELKPKARTRENIAGERKGKTLGGRKKWIPMR